MTADCKGLPGLRGTDHVGFTVPNLDEAVDFFVNVIGCEPFYELGPFQSDDDWMLSQLNVHPRAVMKRLRFLRCRNGSNFELFEYDAPDQNSNQPKNSDVGGLSRTVFEDIPEAKDRVGMLRNTLAKFGAGMLVRNIRACCFERLGVRDSISGLLTTEREAIGGLQEYDPHSWYVIVFEQI